MDNCMTHKAYQHCSDGVIIQASVLQNTDNGKCLADHIDPGRTIPIGRCGEHLAIKVLFDVSKVIESYGPGNFSLVAQRAGDEAPYPCEVTVSGTNVVWIITSTDVSMPGEYGLCELRYCSNDILVKSRVWKTWADFSLGESTEVPPEPAQGWVDQVLEAGAAAKIYAEQAQSHLCNTDIHITAEEREAWNTHGKDGVGIQSVTQTTSSTEDGGANVVTVTKTDGTTSTFTVHNGSNGADGVTPTIGENGNWYIGDTDTGKPSRGEAGPAGSNGSNGADGKDGADGYTPQKGIDYFDGKDGAPGKDGEPGAPGRDGLDGADGYTPVKGIDYYTEEEKAEMMNNVKSAFEQELGNKLDKPYNTPQPNTFLKAEYSEEAGMAVPVWSGIPMPEPAKPEEILPMDVITGEYADLDDCTSNNTVRYYTVINNTVMNYPYGGTGLLEGTCGIVWNMPFRMENGEKFEASSNQFMVIHKNMVTGFSKQEYKVKTIEFHFSRCVTGIARGETYDEWTPWVQDYSYNAVQCKEAIAWCEEVIAFINDSIAPQAEVIRSDIAYRQATLEERQADLEARKEMLTAKQDELAARRDELETRKDEFLMKYDVTSPDMLDEEVRAEYDALVEEGETLIAEAEAAVEEAQAAVEEAQALVEESQALISEDEQSLARLENFILTNTEEVSTAKTQFENWISNCREHLMSICLPAVTNNSDIGKYLRVNSTGAWDKAQGTLEDICVKQDTDSLDATFRAACLNDAARIRALIDEMEGTVQEMGYPAEPPVIPDPPNTGDLRADAANYVAGYIGTGYDLWKTDTCYEKIAKWFLQEAFDVTSADMLDEAVRAAWDACVAEIEQLRFDAEPRVSQLMADLDSAENVTMEKLMGMVLPHVTAADNGKTLQVVDGHWAVV